MADRIPCCVPHCRRTIARERLAEGYDDRTHWEWICSKHWTAIPRRRRLAYLRAKRQFFTRPGSYWRAPALCRLWIRLKREAIERAAGL